MMESNNFWQVRGSGSDKAVRAIFERNGNCFLFLFFDTNHHIYPDTHVKHPSTYKYTYCPLNGFQK